MPKIKKNQRIAVLARVLSSHPWQIFTLNHFSELFQASKATVCEDIAMIGEAFRTFHLGDLESVAGAGGGVRFLPKPCPPDSAAFIRELCDTLSEPDRILAGGYIYRNDILYHPQSIRRIGEILASLFSGERPDFVITVETKGTPVAIMTAFYLGCPVVVARRDSPVTEGPLVSINYVTASSRRIQTMSLSKKAVTKGKRALIVDDFMKGGGTARGMQELLKEFHVETVGTGVVIATREPVEKMVSDYTSLLILDQVDEQNGKIVLSPADQFLDKM